MKTLQIAILPIFILFLVKVKSQDTLSESPMPVSGTTEIEILEQNSTETELMNDYFNEVSEF